MNLTNDEIKLLDQANTEEKWNAQCDAIKAARGGSYPSDWFTKVVTGGIADRAEARFGHSTQTQLADTSVETVTLHTGHVHAKPLVAVVTMLLNSLLDDGEAIAFYEAVMLARNPKHRLFGNAGEKLEKYGITQDGVMHDATREVIVASVEGEGLAMKTRSPIAA